VVGDGAFKAYWCDSSVIGPVVSCLTYHKVLAVLQQGLEEEEETKVHKSEPVHRGEGC